VSKGKVIAGVIAVLVVGGAAAAFVYAGSRAAEVVVADVTRGDLSVTVSASGKIAAEEQIDLYPPTAGTIATLEVTDGQRVRAGQVIATMDSGPIEAQLAQAEAAYAGALAQRDAAAKAVPGVGDRNAADAAVEAARSAYEVADLRYRAAQAGLGAPTATEIAQAQAAVALAEAAAAAADSAYETFHETVYLPAPEPRDPALETARAALALARDQAAANLLGARQGLAALTAASDNTAAVAAAKVGRDQAYAAYLGAVAQRDALAKASSVASALEAADAAIAAAARARDLVAETLDSARIVAPVDGVVIFSAITNPLTGVAAGQPAVGSSISPASAPFSIVDFSELTFTAQVDEADITRVSAGMKAAISLDGLPDEEYETVVERAELQSVLTPTAGTAFPVILRIANPDRSILIGMNGSVEIRVETIEDVITMPVEALLEDRSANYVYIVRDGVVTRVEIEIGRLTDTLVEVRSGLAEGDQVVVSDVSELVDGARVRTD
jgi:RND family efflux transporter MFP subunit